jgi:sortase A
MLSGGIIYCLTFYPIIREEIGYTIRQSHPSLQQNLTPIDESFGIVIPKLGANARVIANVNPYDAKEYQRALTRGVAHAKGSSYPGGLGNVFLFSHSSVKFYEATRYNSIFYLIDKLEKGDEIQLFYQSTKYTYHVTDKKIVDAKDVSYITTKTSQRMLTLMTCWPPGTSFKRLIVIASQVE